MRRGRGSILVRARPASGWARGLGPWRGGRGVVVGRECWSRGGSGPRRGRWMNTSRGWGGGVLAGEGRKVDTCFVKEGGRGILWGPDDVV